MLISLAGLTVEVSPRYPDLAQMCRDYMAPAGAKPDFSVTVTERDIAAEDDGNGYPAGYLETLAVYRKLCERALDFDRVLMHGSAFAFDGEGVLFTAPSGTGKSTHAAFWRETYGGRVQPVNDDKPLLTVSRRGVLVSGTPWDGKHHLSANMTVPLRAIVLLGRGETDKLARITVTAAYPALLAQTYRPSNPDRLAATLSLMDRAIPHLSFYRMSATLSPEAAVVACRGIFGPDAAGAEGAR